MGEIGKVQGPEKNVAITEMSLVARSLVASSTVYANNYNAYK